MFWIHFGSSRSRCLNRQERRALRGFLITAVCNSHHSASTLLLASSTPSIWPSHLHDEQTAPLLHGCGSRLRKSVVCTRQHSQELGDPAFELKLLDFKVNALPPTLEESPSYSSQAKIKFQVWSWLWKASRFAKFMGLMVPSLHPLCLLQVILQCPSSHREWDDQPYLLTLVLGMWLALANRMRQKWQNPSFKLDLKMLCISPLALLPYAVAMGTCPGDLAGGWEIGASSYLPSLTNHGQPGSSAASLSLDLWVGITKITRSTLLSPRWPPTRKKKMPLAVCHWDFAGLFIVQHECSNWSLIQRQNLFYFALLMS